MTGRNRTYHTFTLPENEAFLVLAALEGCTAQRIQARYIQGEPVEAMMRAWIDAAQPYASTLTAHKDVEPVN